jgi:hypothetical protein
MRYPPKPRFNGLCSRLLTGIAARAKAVDQDLAALSLEEWMKVEVVCALRHVKDRDYYTPANRRRRR